MNPPRALLPLHRGQGRKCSEAPPVTNPLVCSGLPTVSMMSGWQAATSRMGAATHASERASKVHRVGVEEHVARAAGSQPDRLAIMSDTLFRGPCSLLREPENRWSARQSVDPVISTPD